jgi:hypothetical protein
MGDRHAFVANSHGNLPLLERMLVGLLEAGVEHIHALDSCAYDVEAVIRIREERYPKPVQPGSPGFADYVLASVLSGVVEAPAGEVDRNVVMRGRSRLHTTPETFSVDGHLISVGGGDPAEVDLVVRHAGRRRLDVGRAVPRLDPGHVRDEIYEGEPATSAVIEAGDKGLVVRFVSTDGAVVEGPRAIVARR